MVLGIFQGKESLNIKIAIMLTMCTVKCGNYFYQKWINVYFWKLFFRHNVHHPFEGIEKMATIPMKI
jgi:hypothetical protein